MRGSIQTRLRPAEPSSTAVPLRLGSIVCWHALVAIAVLLFFCGRIPITDSELVSLLGWRWRSQPELIAKNIAVAALLLVFEGGLAYLIWRAARWGTGSSTDAAGFSYCWGYACLIATVFVLAAVFVLPFLNVIFRIDALWIAISALYAWLILAPGGMAARLLSTPLRWRPVCPECGHTVAYAVDARCSECGEPYPCSDRFYRRWGIRRLPWDQRRRTLLFAYMATLALILFKPHIAAWRAGIPDHIGRAVRWWLGNLAVSALSVAMPFGVLSSWLRNAWSPGNSFYSSLHLVPVDPSVDTVTQIVSRIGLTWLIWTVAVGIFPVAVGVGLAAATPRVQPAARIGMTKWTLYLAAVPIGVGYLCFLATLIVTVLERLGFSVGRSASNGGFINILDPATWADYLSQFPSEVVLGCLTWWGAWWAIGVASQPYLRKRGFFVFLGAFAAYLTVVVLTAVVLDLDGLGALL